MDRCDSQPSGALARRSGVASSVRTFDGLRRRGQNPPSDRGALAIGRGRCNCAAAEEAAASAQWRRRKVDTARRSRPDHECGRSCRDRGTERFADRIRRLEAKAIGDLVGGEANAVLALEQRAKAPPDRRIFVVDTYDPGILQRFEQPA
jgi:hypothetical protein